MTWAFRCTPTMLSMILCNLAIIGFAIWGIVYVPIPAYEKKLNLAEGKRSGIDLYLIVDELLLRAVFLEHREKVDNI